MKSRTLTILKYLLGWPLSLLAFFFIAKIIYDKAPALTPHITSLNPVLLFYGILSFVIFYFLRSYIWYRIVKNFNASVHFRESSYLWSISELKRYIPGNVWSFLGRAMLFNSKGVEKKDIGKGLIYEAEIFVIGCVIVSLLALPFLLPVFNAWIGWAFVLVVVAEVLFYIFLRPKGNKFKKYGSIIFPPFPPFEIIKLITISTVALIFFGLGNYFVISSAFLLDPQLLWQLVGIFVLAFVAGYLSVITPAGLGVREGIMIFALTKSIGTAIAAFAALFSRLLLIISELIFIGLSYILYKAQFRFIRNIEKWIFAHPYETIVLSLALIYTIYFATISMLRYDNFYAGRFDLGNMAQTVWNTSVGNFFMLTDPNGTKEVSRLAFHADFILVLLAPFYWIWPDPRVILIVQAAVTAVGAYFVYLITKKVLNQKVLGTVLAFAYLISPAVQRVTIYDFHAPALATTFLLGTFYFYLQKKYVWFFVFAFLAAICKEQIWAIIAVFGIFLMIHHKKFVMGALTFVISAGMFYFLVSYAIPQTLGENHFALDYFAEFGSSPAEIIRTMIFSPDKVIAVIMQEEQMRYIKQLFGPLGYLSYLAPWMLIFAGPDLMINLLSSNSQLHQIYYQYSAAITPFIFIAAIYGIWVLRFLLIKISPQSVLPYIKNNGIFYGCIILYLLYHSLNGAYLHGPMPGSREPNLNMMTKPEKNRDLINKTLASFPPEAKVAASNNVGAHLSNRRHIYVLPKGAEQADILVFLLTDSEKGSSFKPEQEQVKHYSKDPRYRIVVQKDEFTVFEKVK